jgi:hypothetical protein
MKAAAAIVAAAIVAMRSAGPAAGPAADQHAAASPASPAAASAAAMRLRAAASTCSARWTQHGQGGRPLDAISPPPFPDAGAARTSAVRTSAGQDQCRGRDAKEGGDIAAAASTGH